MARQREVDLVEVASQARPPVARLMDYGRFKYEQSKKEREQKKQQHTSELREVRMKTKIDDHDIDFKTRTAEKLLLKGDKVKVSVMFRGREITHPQIGRRLLERVTERLDPIASIEKEASLEGRMMTTILVPDKKKIAARDREASRPAESTATDGAADEPEAPDDETMAELEAPAAEAPQAPEADDTAAEASPESDGASADEPAGEADEERPADEAASKTSVSDNQ